uniref:Uncharacterized protein n=1 Tax=Anopheles atroparvus TaxID=41427 RepID=A0A182JGN3_ANOAO
MKHTNSPLNRAGVPVALLLGAALVLIAAGLAHSAPAPSNVTNSILEHLRTVKSSWTMPCNGKSNPNGTESHSRRSGPKNRTQLALAKETLETQINQSLIELDNWREVSKDIDKHTNWNNEERKKKFAFLVPFKHDERKMYNRLSVYWASLEMVSFLTKGQGESTIVSRQEQEAVDEVQEGIRQLLCQLQSFNSHHSKNEGPLPRPMAVDRMSQQLQPFHLQDPSEIRIHIWYVMCRLDCFLTNMQQHMRNRIDSPRKRTGPRHGGRRKPAERKDPCDKCPHKPEPKRNAQQNKQQQQRRQQPDQQKQDAQLQKQPQNQHHKKPQKPARQQGGQKNHNRAQRNNTRKPKTTPRHAVQG